MMAGKLPRSRLNSLLREAEDQALFHKDEDTIARIKLLQSKLLDQNSFEERYTLIVEAYEVLQKLQSDERGRSALELGQVLTVDKQTEMAEFYAREGLKINHKMLRKIDDPEIFATLSHLARLQGKEKDEAKHLYNSVKASWQLDAPSLAADKIPQLAILLEKRGYGGSAITILEEGLERLDKTLDAETEKKSLRLLKKQKARLLELLVEGRTKWGRGDKSQSFSPEKL
jgi:hypothetical protein